MKWGIDILCRGPLKHSWLNATVNAVMVVFTVITVNKAIIFSLDIIQDPITFQVSEFTINYQGGFVRRGLLGELILQFCTLTGCHPILIIAILSFASFILVVAYLVRQFAKHEICWWILPTSYMLLASYMCVIRKDFLVIAIFIAAIHLYGRTNWHPAIRLALLSIPAAVIILIYEGMGFVILPVVYLLAIYDRSYRANMALRITALMVPVTAMCAVSVCHGDINTAQAIHNSWMPWAGEIIDPSQISMGLGAIGWTLDKSLETNESIVLASLSRPEVYKVIYRFAMWILILYIGCRYLSTMTLPKGSYRSNISITAGNSKFSSLLVAIFVCMLPLWLGLSCDSGRLSMHLFIITFVTYWSVPHNFIPLWLSDSIGRINHLIDRAVTPRPGIITAMLLFTGISPWAFFANYLWRYSVIGTIINYVLYGYDI